MIAKRTISKIAKRVVQPTQRSSLNTTTMAERPRLAKRPSSHNRDVSPPPTKRRQQSTTTSKAVASFFTPVSKKEPESMTWRTVHDTLLIGRYNAPAAASAPAATSGAGCKVAAFDLDSTLITPASGKKFARDATDWKWWDGRVPSVLRRLHADGYVVAVVSNQGGISLKPDPKKVKSDLKRLADFKGKVSAVFKQLDLPISVYAATGHDRYRKPRVGTWEELLEDYDLERAAAVDLEHSFFVGDAGGRESVPGGPAKDHSCVDRDFAANAGIKFHTPEEYFLHKDPRPFAREFDPTVFLEEQAAKSTPATSKSYPKTDSIDIVLFCGSPGAGKSSFYWRHLQPLGYGRVNQDILKSREKCLKSATALVEEGTSVVVDNTNADPATRADWIALAEKLKVAIRCVLFTAPMKVCEHNDTVRALSIGTDANPEHRLLLPKTAFFNFAKRYREPKLAEGFQDIIQIDFEFEGSEEQKALWSKFWL